MKATIICGWCMETKWIVLRDNYGRYLGKINLQTLTLILSVGNRQEKTFEFSQTAKLIETTPRQEAQTVLQFS